MRISNHILYPIPYALNTFSRRFRGHVQLHSLEGPTLAAAEEHWEQRADGCDGVTARVQTTLYAAHKGRIKVL